ncbi:MAG: ShlB/FhaC/HecB family hemolysin secretion/activation protein [Steroidobacteraceae bacterium]
MRWTPAARAAEATSGSKFDVWQFIVLGNHVLPQTAVESAVYPFLGPDRDITTVQQAAAALTNAYKQAGYETVYVDVPPQEVSNGVVRLEVTEGRLEWVHVHGAKYFSDRQIRAALPALTPGQTPLLSALRTQLNTLNSQTADRFVTPVLNAGSKPGLVDADVNVKDRIPLHGSVSYDNRHTADTTPNRLTAMLSYTNLWQRLDSISLLYQTAPANRQNASVEMATYAGHIPGSTGLAELSYTHTSSNVLALGTLGVLGKGNIYGLHWEQPLPGTSTFSQSFNAGADYKQVRTEVFPDAPSSTSGGSSSASSTPVTAPVKYVNWSGVYSAGWRMPTRIFTTSLAVNFGVRDLANHANTFENARYQATPDYLYLRFSGSALQSLPAGFAVLGRLSGQWADSPLVNNEQFSLGGEDTVRGYLEAETLGDTGAAGTFELHSPDFGRFTKPVLSQLYLFGFVDAGVATLLDALPGQDYHVDLWSTGVGLQLAGPWGLNGSVDYAIPEENGIRTRKHHERVDFSVHFGF